MLHAVPARANPLEAKMAAVEGVCNFHSFLDMEELSRFRSDLLGWYDAHRRDLPWRTLVRKPRPRPPSFHPVCTLSTRSTPSGGYRE